MSTLTDHTDPQTTPVAPTADEAARVDLIIQKIYVKDASFECPSSPEIFKIKPWEQSPKLELDYHAEKLAENTFELILKLTLTTHVKEHVAYLAEVQQAGIFTLQNISMAEMDMLLGTYCPATLFPYAREYLAGMIIRGGFPATHLEPINFDLIYLQKKREMAALSASGSDARN
jgi:preprotein translocase subunit SecB